MEETTLPELEQEPPFRWARADLLAFAAFFILTVIFFPAGAFLILRIFRPGLQPQDLSGVEQILLQGLMDLALVGFILVLVRMLHGRPFLESVHWIPAPNFRTGLLISGGAFLALTVLIASAFFPAPSVSPLEKLLTTTEALAVFVVFGVAVAPLLEEIIFRGFLFTVLTDVFGFKVALPVTAILFALLHVPQLRGNWPAVLLIFAVGYVLSLIRHRSNSMIPSFIVHTAYNGMIFGISALALLTQHGAAH